MNARFDRANLTMSSFKNANAKGAVFNSANLIDVNFAFANLQNADFMNTMVTDSQLKSALSIQNARLPNGTLGQDTPLIKNGNADCSIAVAKNWQLKMGAVTTVVSRIDESNCIFALRSNDIGATMSQRVNPSGAWNQSLWKTLRVTLRARMTSRVSIQMEARSRTGKVLDQQLLRKKK
jgi:hypothetical protein